MTVKLIEVAETRSLSVGTEVQNLHIADESGGAELDLWGEHVGRLSEGKSYNIRNPTVKLYNDEYRLTTPKSGLVIDEIQDLFGVTEVRKDKSKKMLKEVTIIGVKALRYSVVCVSCNKSGVIATENNPRVDKCTKCLTTSLMTMCKKEVCRLDCESVYVPV